MKISVTSTDEAKFVVKIGGMVVKKFDNVSDCIEYVKELKILFKYDEDICKGKYLYDE